MVALRCAQCTQENGQVRIFVLVRQNTAITSYQLRVKSGSGKFHHLCKCYAVYTRDSICPDKTYRQAFYDTQVRDPYPCDFQLVSD